MQIPTDPIKITGEDVHLMLKELINSHALMVTAISAAQLAKNHALMMSLSHNSNLNALLTEAEDSMLEPSNSCGDISNLICDLFLGTKKAQEFAQSKYILFADGGENLYKSIQGDANILLRFEIDKRIDPDEIVFRLDISSISDFQKSLNCGEIVPSLKQLIVIDNALCRITQDSETKRYIIEDITPLVAEKQILATYVQQLNSTKNLTLFELQADEIYDTTAEAELASFARQRLHYFEPVWKATHSFTTFIPASEDGSSRMPHQYQAYFGKYTLQEWFRKDAPTRIANLGIKGYITLLDRLSNTEGSEQLKQIQCELFALPLYIIPILRKVRVKYMATTVQPEQVYQNICALKLFIEQCPGETPEQKLSLYKQKARIDLSEQLTAEINRLKELHAKSSMNDMPGSEPAPRF